MLDLRKITTFTDFFVICSAVSSRRAQAIKEALEESELLKNQKILHEEGARDGKWIAVDYGDVIVHILYEPVRKFYDLDHLWGDAEPVEIKWPINARIPDV